MVHLYQFWAVTYGTVVYEFGLVRLGIQIPRVSGSSVGSWVHSLKQSVE
ncbi:MAG: hypothetical protein ACFFDI_01805 [Promethearchaeota archaeon]